MVYITTNTHACLDQSIDLCVLQDACHELFGVWGDFYSSRTQHAEVIKSLHHGYLRSEARYGDGDISITELNKIVHSHVLQSSRQLTHCIVVCDLYLDQDSEVDGAEVQEKVKEVICKTITTLPLTADTTSKEKLNSDLVSSISTCRCEKPLCLRIAGEKGALQQNNS